MSTAVCATAGARAHESSSKAQEAGWIVHRWEMVTGPSPLEEAVCASVAEISPKVADTVAVVPSAVNSRRVSSQVGDEEEDEEMEDEEMERRERLEEEADARVRVSDVSGG